MRIATQSFMLSQLAHPAREVEDSKACVPPPVTQPTDDAFRYHACRPSIIVTHRRIVGSYFSPFVRASNKRKWDSDWTLNLERTHAARHQLSVHHPSLSPLPTSKRAVPSLPNAHSTWTMDGLTPKREGVPVWPFADHRARISRRAVCSSSTSGDARMPCTFARWHVD